MGEGLHKDVKQMIAPAGAALIYDARTWHRACDELNISGQDRVGLLNAVAPTWVLPMMDKRSISDRYLASDAQQALTQRERNDIIRLCHGPIADAPVGMPVLSTRALKAS
jgi:ectoine hydroxylase-related dioxygenase (phytanoyl-CoA dioxygenase family)